MTDALKNRIKDRYGAAARAVAQGQSAAKLPMVSSGCCGPSAGADGCCGSALDARLADGAYTEGELSSLPESAVGASLGCGNPTALAQLSPGEVVLDLGSGGGIDVLLSARRVGPNGKAYGLDMTDDMLALARQNQQRSGITNVEFLKGDIEDIPLPEGHVNVIISNCVINLAGDKDRVLREAFRVLSPGGRLAVSDMVWQGDRSKVPQPVLSNLEAWVGCIAGALSETEYREKLAAAGFVDVEVQAVTTYNKEMAASMGFGHLLADVPDDVSMISAFVRASKP